MDHRNPLSVVTPTLDGPVLMALAATTGSSTGAHVHRMAGAGSPDGVRRVLARLVRQGVVLAEEQAHATLYRLNREHVATTAIVELTRLRGAIMSRLQQTIDTWEIGPIHASLYGSFARADADEASDIDFLFVVEPATTNDDRWLRQLDDLARLVQLWTGNPAHVVDTTPEALACMVRDSDPLVGSWRADAIHLAGTQLIDLLRSVSLDVTPNSRTLL